jgi:predicted metal-dependent hydrolase
MNTLQSSRRGVRAPQMALRLGPLPNADKQWREGCAITYLGGSVTVRLGTLHGDVEFDGANLKLPLPPEATARQIQDSAEAWLRQQCVKTIEAMLEQVEPRQLVLVIRRLKIQLSFAARSPWIAAESDDTLRCNWRLIELSPAIIEQYLKKALIQLTEQHVAMATNDLFGTSAV